MQLAPNLSILLLQKLMEGEDEGMIYNLMTKSIYRNQLLFYSLTTNYQKDKLIFKIPFIAASTRIKYLGTNITAEVKNLYILFDHCSKYVQRALFPLISECK